MTAFCLVPDGFDGSAKKHARPECRPERRPGRHPDGFDGFVFNPSKIHAVLDGILTGLTGLTGFF